ncbi:MULTISPECIES: hypothetical protein [unclassified Arenibacter]|uniref:hypothetical protein n=1 Tax=unclassified Arenibacter TaxID=2615047 RepID=UPI000E343320|nr:MULTISPECIES: hypothetical protein [unclassified Arenibacter]MCM4164298.1 hypothetical protein [Arenibacter sp. A80]RFT56261.1 hypothetical protein D0S24_11900 [Arenibacter sp. P308M17]
MKNNNIMYIGLFLTSVLMFVTGCEPIEDRDYLENSTDVSGVELVATQSTPGGNLIELSMVTPGVTGYWDYNLGKAFTDKVSFIYPIPGSSTFTFTGTLGAEFFTKTIDVQVDQLDNALDQDWYDLVSNETGIGKTWVFAGGPDPDGQRWWYMSPPDDAGAWETAWWNAAGDCCPPVDAAGRMQFDLDGAANFTYYSGPDASPQVSSFVLDVANQTLQINDGDILGSEQGNQDGLYTIVSLTEDEMILYVPNNAGGTGWTWIFRPE